jgi:hypothetical protein
MRVVAAPGADHHLRGGRASRGATERGDAGADGQALDELPPRESV